MSFLPDTADMRWVIDQCGRMGSAYTELYAQRQQNYAALLDDGRIEQTWSGSEEGVGLRLCRDAATVYVIVNSLDPDAILAACRPVVSALSGLAAGSVHTHRPPGGNRPAPRRAAVAAAAAPAPATISATVAAQLRRLDHSGRNAGPAVAQISAAANIYRRQIVVLDSAGVAARDDRWYTGLQVTAVATRGNRREVGQVAPALACDPAAFFAAQDAAAIGQKVALQAEQMLEAVPAPTGALAVVVGNGRGGTLIHEACVHPLEGDFIARDNSVYRGMLGEMIAAPTVTVVDDAVAAGDHPGAFSVDDEGCPGQTNILVEQGRLRSYLTDAQTAAQLQHRRTGNGRRQSYEYMPMPRMTNTFIAPGQLLPEEIIRATPHGIYARDVAGGEVNQVTGEFIFTVSEGYLIEGGRLTRPIQRVTLVGSGPAVLRNIDLVGSDLRLAAALCGKNGQTVTVGVGQPTIRVREMVVGGTNRGRGG